LGIQPWEYTAGRIKVCLVYSSHRPFDGAYTVKKVIVFPSPAGINKANSPWPGKNYLFSARESLVRGIPAGAGEIGNLFYSASMTYFGTLLNSVLTHHKLNLIPRQLSQRGT
jgi:hypothetical protein